MPEIEDRLAAVRAEDLPPVDPGAIRRRVRTGRRRQRAAAVFGLAVLVAGSALAATSLPGRGGSPQVAETVASSPGTEVRPGTWTLAEPTAVTVTDTSLAIAVVQVDGGCGSSFSVREPVVTLEEERIVITVEGDYTPPEPDVIHTCQGTVQVVPVELPEPIGDRVLIDGFDDGERWQPAADGDPATWVLSAPDAVTPESTVLELSVTRIACASGFTGEVLEPVVTYTENEVLIRAEVETGPEAALCPGNPWEPITLELTEPVGDRVLVDEICRRESYSGHSFCLDGNGLYDDGVRWLP